MTEPDASEPTEPVRASRARRSALIIVAAVVVVLIIVAVSVQLTGGSATRPVASESGSPSPGSPSPSSSATATPDPSADPTESPAPSVDPVYGEPVGESVAPDEEADFGNGLSVRILDVVPFTLSGSGVGEVGGPAVRVTLEMTNASDGALDLTAVSVNGYYGDDGAPAAPVASDAESVPLQGALAAGDRAEGRYSFSVPEDERASLVVTVSGGAGIPIVVFDPS